MAEEALALFLSTGGTFIAYVGEWDGDTATLGFERSLLASCELKSAWPLPSWGEVRAMLSVWKRRLPAALQSTLPCQCVRSPLTCGICGYSPVVFSAAPPTGVGKSACSGASLTVKSAGIWRCRLTGVLRCSEACATAGLQEQMDEAALRLALTPQLESAGASRATTACVAAGSRVAAGVAPFAWGSPAVWVRHKS